MILNKGFGICWMLLVIHGRVQHTDCQTTTEPPANGTIKPDYNGSDDNYSSDSYNKNECEDDMEIPGTECKDQFGDCADLIVILIGGCDGTVTGHGGKDVCIGRDWCPVTCNLCGMTTDEPDYSTNSKDTEPPSLTCPIINDQYLLSHQWSVNVTWTSPIYKDNSGIEGGRNSTHDPPQELPIGNHEIVFYAWDEAGNTATCSILIQVTNDKLPTMSTKTTTLNELLKTNVTEDNVNYVAGALAEIILTSNKNSEVVSIETVQEIFSNIVSVGSSSPEVTEEVVETINYILDADISEGQNINIAKASSLILKAVEEQIAQTLRQHGKFESIKANIAVQSVTVNRTEAGVGIGFEVRRTQMGFGKDGDGTEPDSLNSIQLPEETLYGNNDTQVSFVSFNDDKLFRSKMSEEENNTIGVLGPIISADVLGKDIKNIKEPVVIRIAPSQGVEAVSSAVLATSICVYWDFNLRDGIGDWAEDGCVRVAADSEGITCSCNHLTNFAVLVDFAGQGEGQTEPGTLTFALDIISKVGCAVSIVALCITLLIFLLSSRLRISLQRKILIQFCFAMLFLYLSFLIGIDSKSKSGCLFAGLLLHYFVLSTMFWMAVEARHMYITLVSESDRVGRQFMRKAGVFAWGGALIPVLVVLAVKQDEYLANAYCFVAPGYGLYFGLLCPIAVVILHNTVTFVFVAKTLMSAKSYALKPDLEADATDNTDAKEVAQRLLNAFAVSVILGLTWAFGFLAIEEARGAFQLLFCIFNSFQGVLIFILFCYAQKDVRKHVFDKCCADAVPHPKPKKPKQAIDAAGNPISPGPTTSMSNSTRVTGEIYSDDNDTLVTKVDDATLLVTTTESTQENDLEEVELQTTSTDVGKPDPKESVGTDDEALIPNSTATEETGFSLGSETDSHSLTAC